MGLKGSQKENQAILGSPYILIPSAGGFPCGVFHGAWIRIQDWGAARKPEKRTCLPKAHVSHNQSLGR